jgi:hypothetical protein
MKPKHSRKIVFSGIDLVGASMSHDLKIMEVLMGSLESLMIDSGFLKDAPFLWVGMVFRYGLKNENKTQYRRIDKKDGELELAKELDMRVLLTADETDPELLLKDFLEIATLDSLIHAGEKYKLKINGLLDRRSQLGQIPEWDPLMDDRPELLKERYKASLPVLH